jgi:sulfate-transporting ATPase
LLAIAASITLILHTIYKYSRFGLATTANAENPRAAAALGISSNATALINWVLGGAIAGLAGVLLASVFQVQLESFTGLIVPVVAAGLLGGMRSFLLTFAGGAVIGITQAWAGRYISGVGWGDAIPLILIIATLVIRGRGLTGRPSVRIRYPGTGSGAIKWRGLAALLFQSDYCSGSLHCDHVALAWPLSPSDWPHPVKRSYSTTIHTLAA